MRFVFVFALLAASCAHQRVYSLGDDYTIEENERGIYVFNERHAQVIDLPKGPVFMVRPHKDFAVNRCYEGFFNPREIGFLESRAATEMMPFALCPDPDQPLDPSAFRVDMKITMRAQSGMRYISFTAKTLEAGSTDVGVEGQDAKRVKLASDVGPFRGHPELIGAMIAVGAVHDASSGLRR